MELAAWVTTLMVLFGATRMDTMGMIFFFLTDRVDVDFEHMSSWRRCIALCCMTCVAFLLGGDWGETRTLPGFKDPTSACPISIPISHLQHGPGMDVDAGETHRHGRMMSYGVRQNFPGAGPFHRNASWKRRLLH